MKVWKDMQPVLEILYERLIGWWIAPLLPYKMRTARSWPRALETQDPRERKRWFTRPTWLVRLGRPLARAILFLIADVKLTGVENLPAVGAFILAGNHLSMLDPILLCALLPRYPYFMSKQELFRHPLLAWFLRNAGAFPVDRRGGDAWAMTQARRILQQGQVLGIFPEGTRSRQTGALGKGKTGAVRLALEANVPIVPVAILGSDRLLTDYRNPLRPPVVQIHIGAPMYTSEMITSSPPSYEEIQNMTILLMRRIAEMMPPEKRGAYDR